MAFGRPVAKAALIGPAAVFGLIFLSGVVVPSTTAWEKLVLGLLTVSLAICLARIGSLAVIATTGQLVIRNMRDTHRIAWSQIDAITEPGPIPVSVYRKNALARQPMTLLVMVREGAAVSATLYDNRLLGHQWGRSTRDRRRAISDLNALLAERS